MAKQQRNHQIQKSSFVKKQAPTFGPQSEIGEAAERIVRDQLSSDWKVRDRLPDVHIDFEIEQKSQGEPTALTAYVQVKGIRKPSESHGFSTVRIKTKHLLYWNEARRPVILILTDILNRRSCFLFIQQWIREATTLAALAKKSSHKLKIPLANNATDPELFLSEVKRADRYLRDQQSSSPEKAIEFAEMELGNLDQRFQVTLTATRNHRAYTIAPAGPDPVSLALTLPLPTAEIRNTAKDIFAWGKPGKIKVQNTKIEGSPLFEHLTAKNHWFELDLAGATRPAVVKLLAGIEQKHELVVRGCLSMGTEGVAFTSDPSLPLRVNLTMPHTAQTDGVCRINFSVDANFWAGQKLLSVERLEEIARFTVTCIKTRVLETRIQVGALNIAQSSKTLDSVDVFETLAWWSGLLLEAVEAAQYYHLDPTIPDLNAFDAEAISSTERALSLARTKTLNLSHLDFQAEADIWRQLVAENELFGFVKVEHALSVNLLGHERILKFALEPVHSRITRITPSDSNSRQIRVSPTEEPHFRLSIADPVPQ